MPVAIRVKAATLDYKSIQIILSSLQKISSSPHLFLFHCHEEAHLHIRIIESKCSVLMLALSQDGCCPVMCMLQTNNTLNVSLPIKLNTLTFMRIEILRTSFSLTLRQYRDIHIMSARDIGHAAQEENNNNKELECSAHKARHMPSVAIK